MSRLLPDDVDVAVVSHNGRLTLPGVFDALMAAGVPPARLTCYDIASTDETAAWLLAHWPGVRHVRLDVNDGPNPARNLALAQATRPYLLLVDSDAEVEPDAIGALRDAIRSGADIAVAVPVVVHRDRPDRIQYAGAQLHFLCEAVNPWSERLRDERGPLTLDIGTAAGVTLLLNVATAQRVGGFDPRYFMGKEDGEFCYRLKLAGYRIVETPRAIVRHGSRPRSTWLFPYQIRNRWHFMLKNYAAGTLAVLAPALVLHEILQFAFLLAKGEMGAWWQGVRGLKALWPSLSADRRAVAALRRVRDADILAGGPLMVRADLVGGGGGRLLKSWYDAWLRAYWAVARRLLGSTVRP